MLKRFIFSYLIIGIVFRMITAGNDSCGAAFKGKCWCGVTEYDGNRQFVVNCTSEGFSDTSVLSSMPREVQVLIFTGNVKILNILDLLLNINIVFNLKHNILSSL